MEFWRGAQTDHMAARERSCNRQNEARFRADHRRAVRLHLRLTRPASRCSRLRSGPAEDFLRDLQPVPDMGYRADVTGQVSDQVELLSDVRNMRLERECV